MRKITRSKHLKCTEGTSNKFYSVAIVEEDGKYSVIVARGPIGGHITRDVKTDTPGTLETAEKEFDAVVKQKSKKYVDAETNDNIFDLAA